MNTLPHSSLHQIAYVSSARKLIDNEGLEKLLLEIRAKNAEIGVTGMMLYADGNIIQVLEGTQAVVQELMAKINDDPRHQGVIMLLNEAINRRQFEDWSMGFKKLSNSEMAGFSDFLNSTPSNEQTQLMTSRAGALLTRFRRSMN